MSNPSFRFRQFEVWHDRCAMKVGTDAVLLGAWCPIDEVKDGGHILDIGSGCAVVALMLAQRCEGAQVDGVEIDAQAAQQAQENIDKSPWGNRMHVYAQSIQDYTQQHRSASYQLIVSNPPYFNNALKNPDAQRLTARHTDTLSSEDLLRCAGVLLQPHGRLSLVLPCDREQEILSLACAQHFTLTHRTWVHTRPGQAPKRVLLSWVKAKRETEVWETHLNVEAENAPRSEEYQRLTQDFYL